MIMLKHITLLLVLGISPGVVAKPKNVLLICVDDLRPELASFGATYIHSPNIDRLVGKGRAFQRHFVNAPSCGPSRYTLLIGRFGAADNSALFKRAKKMKQNPEAVTPSMPEWFRKYGYVTVSVGKVSHHPGGCGGKDWNDPSDLEMPNAWDRHLMPCGPWKHPRGAMHGLAHGEIRVNAKDMDVFQSAKGDDSIYPDGLIVEEGIRQLDELAAGKKPFFLAVGVIRPHLPFGAPKKYMKYYEGIKLPPIPHPEKPEGKTTWHKSGEFMKYNCWGKDPREDADFAEEVRRHYAACVSYADANVGRILAKLEETGASKNTVVVLWGDHGWHLGEHAIWGKHSLFEEALHSPLVFWFPGIKKPGVMSDAIVETIDVFPTLCDLTGVPKPSFCQGHSLLPQLENPALPGHTAVAYWKNFQSLRTERYRFIRHKDGFVELYDLDSPEEETRNLASRYPELINKMSAQLDVRLNEMSGESK